MTMWGARGCGGGEHGDSHVELQWGLGARRGHKARWERDALARVEIVERVHVRRLEREDEPAVVARAAAARAGARRGCGSARRSGYRRWAPRCWGR